MVKFLSFIVFVFVFMLPILAEAQCAMCKAVVESNAQSDDSIVEGVNGAILYLMGVPYLLIAGLGYLWYKKFGQTENNN